MQALATLNPTSPTSQNLAPIPMLHLERRFHIWLASQDSQSKPVKHASCNPIRRVGKKIIQALPSGKKDKKPSSAFENLPRELKAAILQLLPLEHQRVCRQVSRAVRACIDQSTDFWAKTEGFKTTCEVPQGILSLCGGLEGYLQLPIFALDPTISEKRLKVRKEEEVPAFPARFIDGVGRYGLIWGFQTGEQKKVVIQIIHEETPRFCREGKVKWLKGDSNAIPPPPFVEDMEFIGDQMKPNQVTKFMQKILKEGSASANHETPYGNTTVTFTYLPVEKVAITCVPA